MAASSTALARIIEQRSWWNYKPQAGPTARPLVVRIARRNDEEKIFAALMLLAEENAIAPVNEARVWAMIERCRGPEAGKSRDGVIGVIDSPDGGIAATVGIVMNQLWYTNSWHCEECWGFVAPLHRSGKFNYAKSLIAFSKWWAEQMGLPLLMGVLSTNRTLGKIRLYSRELPLAGAVFMWRGGGPNV